MHKKNNTKIKILSFLILIALGQSILFTTIDKLFFNTTFNFFIKSVPNPSYVYAEKLLNNYYNNTKLVYHLSSDDPWRSSIALSDSQAMLKMGYNVTLMLSIEGVQLGMKHPHHFLGLNMLTSNVTDFINNGGKVVICETCLKIAGYNNSDIIDGAIIGSPQITANLLNKATVVDY